MAAGWAIKPIATIFTLGVGKPLFLFTLGTPPIHLAIGDVVFKDQTAFCTNLGIATMIRCLTTRSGTDKNSMTGVTPVFAASHLFTYRTLFHQSTSINSISHNQVINLAKPATFLYQHNHFPAKFPVRYQRNRLNNKGVS